MENLVLEKSIVLSTPARSKQYYLRQVVVHATKLLFNRQHILLVTRLISEPPSTWSLACTEPFDAVEAVLGRGISISSVRSQTVASTEKAVVQRSIKGVTKSWLYWQRQKSNRGGPGSYPSRDDSAINEDNKWRMGDPWHNGIEWS